INVTEDVGIKDALTFLMTREIAHQKSFEKALYAIDPNFPPGKLPGMPGFTDLYVNTSKGEGDVEGPWNSGDQWKRLEDVEGSIPLDGGDGMASVKLNAAQKKASGALLKRTLSDPGSDPLTGADLGAGPGAGTTTQPD
ncbi:MAG: Mn-containing catalase, partial [Hyphomicrobiales bacterium]|nr:Mn-containing catalase [Hyphomicrobiales bacterium]